MNIPKIDITSEIEDDDHCPFSILESLTDVEDLYEESEIVATDVITHKKYKLKINLNDNTITTDLEDFDASDNENNTCFVDQTDVVYHNNMDLDAGVCEETYKIKQTSLKGNLTLQTYESTRKLDQNTDKSNNLIESVLTDIENFSSDENEYENLEELPETVVSFDMLPKNNSINMSEKFKSLLAAADNSDDEDYNSNTMFLQVLPTNMFDLTDVEEIFSDSNDEMLTKKTRTKKKRVRANRHKIAVTDVEDLELSEAENRRKLVHPRRKNSRKVVRSQSLAFESDHECNSRLPFPVCKKIAAKQQSSLYIPEYDDSALTDTEEFDGDVSTNLHEKLIDEDAFEKKLNEMANDYSETRENHHVCLDDFKRLKEFEVGSGNKKCSDAKLSNDVHKLTLPSVSNVCFTDVENINTSSDEELEQIEAPILQETYATDEEGLSDTNQPENKIFEIVLPPPTRNLVLLQESDSILPNIKILPLGENHPDDLKMLLENDTTDEENFSGDDDDTDVTATRRISSPHLPLLDGGSVEIVEDLQKNKKTLTVLQNQVESKTDTEEVIIENIAKKRKHPKLKSMKERACATNKNLVVKLANTASLTDTEDIYFSDGNRKSKPISFTPIYKPEATDVEYLDTSDSDGEERNNFRILSCTPQHMREMGGEVVLTKENVGPITPQDRLQINKKVPQYKVIKTSPVCTDSEDMNASTDDDNSYSRNLTATPSQIHTELDQVSSTKINSEFMRKFDAEAPEEIMYLKGGSYKECNTDTEDIFDNDFEYLVQKSAELNDNLSVKIKVMKKHGSPPLGTKKELEASRPPKEPVSSQAGPLEHDQVQDLQSMGSQIITYESVLLTQNRNMPTPPADPQIIHKTTSYTKIDSMLEKMLYEVEKQEKIFGLDLDILEPEEACVNTLELLPCTDALIEIPVKKTIKKPKVFESVQEILIDNTTEMPFETMEFHNGKNKQEISNQYDLINFDDNISSGNQLENIAKTIDNLIVSVNDDEACMLLRDSPEGEYLERPSKYELQFVRRASSESLSDNYPDSWNDPSDNYIDDDYEQIENNSPLKYAYQLHDNRTGNDIWWEGTYRNLSIVPEEDEENVSLLSNCTNSRTYTSKPYLTAPGFKITSDENSSSDSSSTSLSSSDEGHYETFEKVVKAEVKLLVKTSERGKEAIEIRSVREFMENAPKDTEPNENKEKCKRKNKIGEKLNNITHKFSNILDVNKKKSATANYSLLSDSDKAENFQSNRRNKPSFTLPRLFVRTPEAESMKKVKSESNLLSSKELSKSGTELVATSSERFPLQFDPSSMKQHNDHKVDLYANLPFYPCYHQYTTKPIATHTNPFTEFISNPFHESPTVPQAYCDWLPEKEDLHRGEPTSTTQYIASYQDHPVGKSAGDTPAGLSIDTSNLLYNFKVVTDQTNALIESESRAEPFDSLTNKHYRITKVEDEKVDSSSKTETPKEERKHKKGFLGTLKTFVGKSVDHSDSDSEKSAKKEKPDKKPKKEKKKGKKKSGHEQVSQIPVATGKPKLPTPTEEHKEFFVKERALNDLPPSYKPPEAPKIDNVSKIEQFERIELDLTNVPVTDLDIESDVDEAPTITIQAEKIVKDVINDSENALATINLSKSPKKERKTRITFVEEVTKTIAPVVIEEEEFSIIVDPTKKESPKKSRETFTLNIDESIEKIEKEIMEKSPILSEETILKPVVDPNSPVRSSHSKDHVYEDIEAPLLSPPPDNLAKIYDVEDDHKFKSVTSDLSKKEILYSDNKLRDEATKTKEKGPDSQKMKRKHNKLFGLFGKYSKDADESDDDSKKEIIEKQDREILKEKKVEEIDENKKGFLGLFSKKSKKEDSVEDAPLEAEFATKPVLSKEVVMKMAQSTDFLCKEVEKYEDSKVVLKKDITVKSELVVEKIKKQVEFKVDVEEASKKASDSGLLKKFKKPTVEGDKEPKINFSKEVLRDMTNTENFLKDEVTEYHDVKPIVKSTIIKQDEETKVSIQPKVDAIPPSVSVQDASVKEKSAVIEENALPNIFVVTKAQTCDFIKEEVNRYHDVKPIKITEKSTEVNEKVEEKPKSGVGGIFGFFGKKKMYDKEDSVEREVKDVKQTGKERKKSKEEKPKIIETGTVPKKKSTKVETKKDLSDLKDKSDVKDKDTDKPKIIESDTLLKTNQIDSAKVEQELPKSVIKDITDSKDFLQKEVIMYHDVRESLSAPVEPQEKKKESTEKSGGFLGLFTKKSKDQDEPLKVEHAVKELEPKLSTLSKDVPKRDVTKPEGDSKIIEEVPEQEKKSSHLFGIFSKKPKEKDQTKVEGVKLSEEVMKTLSDCNNFINTEIVHYEDFRPVHVTLQKDKLEPVQMENDLQIKEMNLDSLDTVKEVPVELFKKVIVLKDDAKHEKEIIVSEKHIDKIILTSKEDVKETLPPTIKKDLSELDRDINEKLDKLRAENEIYDIKEEKPEVKKISEEELVKSEVVKPELKEQVSVEKDTKDKKFGLFGLFGKRKSQERETSEERHLSKEETSPEADGKPYKKDERRKSGSPFRIFGKKTKIDEDETKKIELSPETAQQMIDTTNFLAQEVENYEDVKLQSDSQVEVTQKLVGKEKSEKSEKRKSGSFFSMFSKSGDQSVESVEVTSEVPKTINLSEEIQQQIQMTQQFLSMEVKNYEDSTLSIQPSEIDESTDGKSSGLFGIFSKKDKKDSPKTTKKYKKQKKEKSIEGTEKIGFIEKIGRKLTSTATDVKDQVDTEADKVKEKVEKEKGKLEAADGRMKEARDTVDHVISSAENVLLATQGIEQKQIQEGTIQCVDQKIDETSVKLDGLKDVVKDQVRDKTLTTIKKNKEQDFSGIHEKFDEELKEAQIDLLETKEDIIIKRDDLIAEDKKASDYIRKQAGTVKDETSNFVNEIMKSFDDHLDHIKHETDIGGDKIKPKTQKASDQLLQKGEDIKEAHFAMKQEVEGAKEHVNKCTDSFRQTVDEKFSSTMKLTEEIAKTLEDKVHSTKEGMFNLEKEGEKVATVVEDTQKELDTLAEETIIGPSKDVIVAEQDSKKNEGFFSKLGSKMSKMSKSATGKVDEVRKQSKDKTKDTLNQSVSEIGEILEKGTTKIIESSKDKKEAVVKSSSEFETQQEEHMKHGTETVSSKAETLVGELGDHIQDKTKFAEKAIEEKQKSVKEAADSSLKQSQQLLDTTEQKICEKSKHLEDSVNKIVVDTKTVEVELKDSLKNISDKMKQDIDLAVSATEQKIEDKSDSLLKKAENNITVVEEKVDKTIKNGTEKISSTLVKTTDQVDDKFIASIDSTKEKISEVKGVAIDVEKKLKQTIKKTSDFVDHAGDKTGATIKQTESKLITQKDAVEKTIDKSTIKLEQKVEQVADDVDSKVVGAVEDAENKLEKPSKSGKGILSKLGRKLSGKDDDFKSKKKIESTKSEESKDSKTEVDGKSKKSGGGFFGKLGDKLSGKNEGSKETTPPIKDETKMIKKDVEPIKDVVENISLKTEEGVKTVKQITKDFINDLKGFPATPKELSTDFGTMTRTTSDYISKPDDAEDTVKISEANIDLSNLPTNIEDYCATKSRKTSSSYVTSPTLARRTVSQRLSASERPAAIEIIHTPADDVSDEESYIVTEPEEHTSNIAEGSRKPLFHIESEDDDSFDLNTKLLDKRGSVQSNVLETLSEKKLDNLVTDLTKNLAEAVSEIPEKLTPDTVKEEVKTLDDFKKDCKTEVDIIEQKLRDLDKALDSLEQVDNELDTSKNDKTENKLRRVERKFERMASEVMDKETEDAKEQKMTTPEVEEKRENEFQQLVSQLSTEEVSDFQKEYSHLWDEHTFSKSDEWDSKTPDSQADAQELPQGEIVYMGPVNLNKDNLVNKAGIEVDVIPIMKSPCASPKPHKKKAKRAKSEMGFYRNQRIEDDRGSLPDLKSSPFKRPLFNTVLQLNPNTFLSNSNDSLVTSVMNSEQRMSRSLSSIESLPKGVILSAVVNWLEKSSPFASTENIDQQSVTTSIPDTMDTSILSMSDENNSLQSFDLSSDKQNPSSKNLPNILISADDTKYYSNDKKPPNLKDPAHVFLEISCGPLTSPTTQLTTAETKTIPQPKPRSAKTPDSQLPFLQSTDDEIKIDKQISPVRDDLLDEVEQTDVPETYSDKKKFWENVTKEPASKRMSLLESASTEKITQAEKLISVHEFSAPPVPKPRSILQSSQSLSESDKLESQRVSVSERAISIDSTASDNSSLLQTELTKISESDGSESQERMMSEYQASFMPPSERKLKTEVEEIKSSIKGEFEKSDSIESDIAQNGNSNLMENTGYISDSEDVEHYISDSEIEDRVPQIRERQMSVFAPPVASVRKSIYERSASLPTEDMYEVSARSIKLRKQYYEEQIKKEMIEEQLISEVEDEPSPERKTLITLSETINEPEECEYDDDDEFKEDDDAETEVKSSVKSLARTFEEKVIVAKDAELYESEEQVQPVPEKTSVKDLAKGYEKQLGSVIAGQRIGQSPIELKGFVLDKHIHPSKDSKEEDDDMRKKFSMVSNGVDQDKTPNDIKDFMEITKDTTVDKDMHKQHVEYQSVVLSQTQPEAHKETTIDSQPQAVRSQQSFSSDKSTELFDDQIKDDSVSKPDSMEVHVDKSEIEDSEKLVELDQDATDFETKSLDSLNAIEMSPKGTCYSDDLVPEITVTLSGIQRRISEESDEYAVTKSAAVTEITEASSPIKQPEEHIQETVWEVSVQSQPESQFDEKVVDIPVSVKVPVKIKGHAFELEKLPGEKDDDLSSSVRDESDLGSEIHQDHSDSLASDKIKSDSQSDIEKIILDSLHQQRVNPEEAKKIASALIEEIEAEIQKRESFVVVAEKSVAPAVDHSKGHVSDYLKHLAETKGLDEREVELVESVLARRQRELAKLARGDTQASSMEITDEDLKYSGAELDYSHVLEQQIDQLEAEKVDDINLEYESTEQEESKCFEDKTGFVDRIAEDHVEELKSSQDYESYEDSKTTSYKKDVQMKTSDSIRGEISLTESKNIIFEEDETVSESLHEETEKLSTHVHTDFKEVSRIKHDDKDLQKKKCGIVTADAHHQLEAITKLTEIEGKDGVQEKESISVCEKDTSELSAKLEAEEHITEETIDFLKKTKLKTEQELDEICKKEEEKIQEKISKHKMEDDGTEIKTTIAIDKTHSKVSSSVTSVDHVHAETVAVSHKIVDEHSFTDLDKLIESEIVDSKIKLNESEIVLKTHEVVKRTSSSESKSSMESGKSPEDQFSTCSSGRKGDSDQHKVPEIENVIMRKVKSDADTSSSSSNLKPERKSGIDMEAYSSSGESYYHSFDLDSNKSRPCSSDVEGLIAAGSSEYESALTSQEISGRSHITSTEYQTAVSSLSSKESMKSLDSESSGNLASVEVSEVSETLVPSTSDLEGDILDLVDQQLLEDVEPNSDWTSAGAPIRQSTEISDSELLSYQGGVNESMDMSEEDSNGVKGIDIQSKMKRSCEMTFQPELKLLLPESPQNDIQDSEEKFGTSLEDGSVLSMSVSSTSSTGIMRTVIELSRADSERLEGSMTISGTSEQLSIDDMDVPRGSRESLAHTPTPLASTDMTTSTPYITTDLPIDSVTITTTSIDENGIQSVSTQVTSETHSPVDETFEILENKHEVEEPKRKGHRRHESTSSFVPSLINMGGIAKRDADNTKVEADKYTGRLSFKEVSSDEKKDVDESEKETIYAADLDQDFHMDLRNGRYFDTELDYEVDNIDFSRPHSHLSKSDSDRERPTSTAFSDDRLDSELVDLVIKSSDITDITDLIEQPISPEPCDETKDDTPELSSEAQASVGELEQEYSAAVSRSPEMLIIDHRRSPTKDVTPDSLTHKQPLEKRDSHGKSSSTSSEKSSFEEAEAEAAFSMVAHVSPAHKIKQICPILEDEDAEKHELETRERAQKEYEKRRSQLRDQSPSFIPDIKVTQHMTPLIDRDFRYPDLELEAQEKELEAQTPQTPASNSSKSSEETDQGREYVLDDASSAIPEGLEQDQGFEPEIEKAMSESKSEGGTVVEATLKESSETDSPNSDSFEMLEKPDLIDDFVVIEEVGKEAREFDSEGKSVTIHQKGGRSKKHDEEVEAYLVKSAPTPLTKMTDIKYYPDGSSSDELGFEFEDSPPQDKQKTAGVTAKDGATSKDYMYEYDRELEANKKWIEQQFQGDQAAMVAAGYGYEMEFERGPLEDIKEEDINDFDPSSSRIGSLGSHKESGGSLGSVKDSYSSTPEYDVLAGRKYFTRSGEHDDVSMSSLQEFENLEQAMSLEMRRYHQGSQDSSSNGSFKTRYLVSKSGQGDDVSVSSLKEFEGLEKACIAAHKIEIKVKEEEELLAQIEEGQESVASESESCETMSGTEKKLTTESDEEDYEKRMFEIEEIIRQAQTNVERFIDLKEAEKTESLGRGDSIEEVSKVPDLDLDTPLVKSTIKVQWKEGDDVMIASTDSLDLKPDKPSHHDSTDSLDQKTVGDIMTASTDSIEMQVQKHTDNIMTDSIEIKDEKNYMISSDSLELNAATSSMNNVLLSDSIDEDGSRIGVYDQSSSSTGKDFSSSAKEEDEATDTHEARADYMLESIESLDPTSSTATHATYQFETDSVFSGSFTSGGSNTMVSSTDTIDPSHIRETVDVAAAVRKVWFDEQLSGPAFTTEYIEDNSKPYVTEVIEPTDDDSFAHVIHRKVELPPEVRKVTFTGVDADEQLKRFIKDFDEGEEVHETEEIDEAGNVHIKKVVQKRFFIKQDGGRVDTKPMSGTAIDDYLKELYDEPKLTGGQGVITRTVTDSQGVKTTFTQQFDIPQTQLTALTRTVAGEEGTSSAVPTDPTTSIKPQVYHRRPLRYDISVDDQTEVDPREHDWRFNLPEHGERDETQEPSESGHHSQRPPITDQHHLSDEMKELLKELEKESKQ